jgi:hypothetical protein
MAKHRAFNADRFLDKFQGREELLRTYAELWGEGLEVEISALDVPSFKQFLVEGDGARKEEFLEELYRVWDLATERGHEDLVAACGDLGYDPDPEGNLPVECLSLKVRTENEEGFNLAYDRAAMEKAEQFSVFQGEPGRQIEDLEAAVGRLRAKLEVEFQDHKKSDRVLVRGYREGVYTNFIIYHEKRTQAVLVFQGTKVKLKVSPAVFRPAQQDLVSYNQQTGELEIEAHFEKEEGLLRRSVAECCLGNAELFEKPEAAQKFNLGVLAGEDFVLEVDEGDAATLIELHFRLKQKHAPVFVIRSKDVLETLDLNRMRQRLAGATIQRAVFKLQFPDDRRGKRVELRGTNKMRFKRATHAEDVLRYLARWGMLGAGELAGTDSALAGQLR